MRRYLPLVFLVSLVACGGGGGSSTSTTPTTPTPTPQANRAPVINSISVTPTFGIATFTAFAFASAATDADGDTVTYTWDIAGNARTGASQTLTFTSSGNGLAALTVTDGKGGTANNSVTFVVGSGSGAWTGTISTFGGISMQLTQSPTSGTITGTFSLPGTSFVGQLDPAAPNRIEAGGRVVLRCKVTAGAGPGGVSDFTLDGQLDTTGRRITGGVTGSGFSGQPFTLTK